MPDAPLTDAELTEIERLASEATAGPWDFTVEDDHDDAVLWGPVDEFLANLGTRERPSEAIVAFDVSNAPSTKNAAFIAASRLLVPRLVRELREARERVERAADK